MRRSGGGTGAVDVNTHNSKPLVSGKQVQEKLVQSATSSAAHTEQVQLLKRATRQTR